MSLFYQIGRGLGHAAIPAIRKSKWVWRTLTGDDEGAIRSETEFGQALAVELRMKSGVSNQAADIELVSGIGRRLSACVRNKLRTFRFEILLEPQPTAMALPGGFIFVSAGLLDFCQRNPDELAFVIAHEMGHVLRGHALERMLGRIGAEGLSSILSRGLLNPALRETGLKWLESSHSREGELEADEFAVRAAAAAGYDAGAGLRLLERLEQLRTSGSGISTYFASHPPEAERRANASSVLRALAPRSTE